MAAFARSAVSFWNSAICGRSRSTRECGSSVYVAPAGRSTRPMPPVIATSTILSPTRTCTGSGNSVSPCVFQRSESTFPSRDASNSGSFAERR